MILRRRRKPDTVSGCCRRCHEAQQAIDIKGEGWRIMVRVMSVEASLLGLAVQMPGRVARE
jgi:hypothetical protein